MKLRFSTVLVGTAVLFALGGNCLAGSPDVGVSFRSIGAFIHNYDFYPFFGIGDNSDFVLQKIFRVTAEGEFRGGADFEAHLVQSWNYSSAPGGETISVLSGGSTADYRTLDAGLDWDRSGETRSSLGLDRFNVRFTLGDADLTIGRQAISLGKAYFWNPLDVFSPFDPNEFDRDYKAGVDAVKLDLYLGDFSGFNVIFAAGSKREVLGDSVPAPNTFDADWFGSALIARFFNTANGWDYALQGGKVYGGYQFGGGAVGEVGPWQIRFEAACFQAHDSPPLHLLSDEDLFEDHCEAVLGIGRYYSNSFDLEIEYLYNGAGDPDHMDESFFRVYAGGSRHIARNLIGIMASHELTPLVHGSVILLHSLSDQSSQFQPGVAVSLSENSDFLVGGVISLGDRPNGPVLISPGIRSEFGTYPNMFYSEYKLYF